MEVTDTELIEKIHTQFRGSGLSLSVAESCTGGYIAHLITKLPGASDFFDSSVVCYSPESKIKLLGVRRSLIRRFGAISEETARAMAIAIREKRGTDFSVSTTGNLGPNPAEDKKVGLVYMAIDWERETTSRGMIFAGTREEIKHSAALSVLQLLSEVVETWA
ncbi:MAG TPA: CinA family protein [Thermodesulfovibrionales bacterium]|jgi:nicotinamide-nucleotide amidase|nr:CinA family protein [Thermodesulfovibrionales bacterium]